jgi:dTDP-glucose 4,6-dehydratase
LRVLVSGGAGFIGSNFIRHLLGSGEDYSVVNLDALTYAGNLENLKGVDGPANYRFHQGDVSEREDVEAAFSAAEKAFGSRPDTVVHFAAESHVDRSIEDPSAFLRTNVIGVQVMLEAARRRGVGRFVYVSTDEVYGSLGERGSFSEDLPLAPNSPYAASKAGGDLIARAYHQTYGFPVIITRCSNNYGPYQFPEKLIPLMIANALEDKPLPVYGDGLNVRDWIYVEDHCRALEEVIRRGAAGEVYNIGGRAEKTNLEVVGAILRMLGKPESLIKFVPDRPGHDRRYAMDITKIERELGWRPRWGFEQGIEATVSWYLDNRDWTERVRSGAYQQYYEQMYGRRDKWVESVLSKEQGRAEQS